MTLEITHGRALFSYRTDPNNDRVIQWRINQSGKRWQPFGTPYTDAMLARQALLKLTQTAADRGAGRGTP